MRDKKNVLILIDDGTRSTPVDRLLPHVLKELHESGIKDGSFEFLQAPGTHRVSMGMDKQGKMARVALIRYGGHVLPIVADQRAELGATME